MTAANHPPAPHLPAPRVPGPAGVLRGITVDANGRLLRDDSCPYPPRLYSPPDPRPTDHPDWESFCATLAAAGFGRHITGNAEQYDRQFGAELWRFYLLARG